jgi:hypothetical protein
LLLGTDLFAGHFKAGEAGKIIDRTRKILTVVVHNKANGIAACAAAKAVIELFVRVYAERGGFFVVKRAARAVILAGFLERNAAVDNVNNVDSR